MRNAITPASEMFINRNRYLRSKKMKIFVTSPRNRTVNDSELDDLDDTYDTHNNITINDFPVANDDKEIIETNFSPALHTEIGTSTLNITRTSEIVDKNDTYSQMSYGTNFLIVVGLLLLLGIGLKASLKSRKPLI
ncbi:hypothetical protein ROZALSC1DRAFT_24130 [Rozella allomycis CSF55]|uniref:Uncharacterized protein n=1 Tax=Rozella allomycis (strain CSF55) TaxID=988480 RepID=A0A4P9YDK2_ROZAC|nr:hypothetical protein ROZALSC1DRAFT_24130 [Rozella allomycis CSF55]